MSTGDTCLNCLGLIPEPNKVYSYAGKFCYCVKPDRSNFNRYSGFPPFNIPQFSKVEELDKAGCKPAVFVTEADGLRIIQEELEKHNLLNGRLK